MINEVKGNAITVRTLQSDDAAALLDFEIENRNWFERYVLARAASTYTAEGIAKHIDDCLMDFAAGKMHPCLVLEDGKIIGRANLKDIDSVQGTTEVGYRIGQAQVGRGVATHALHHLIALAYDRWQLSRLRAFATTENPASRRVLEKAGFVFRGMEDGRAEVNQRLLERCRYEHVRDEFSADRHC